MRKQIMRKKNRTGKRLRLTPLILGGYAAFLGFGLIVIGLAEMKEGIGIVRLLIGLGMAGFGLLGIWDGVRDLVGPDKKSEQSPASQFILTDTSGNRTSNVTVEILQKQLESLMESDKGGVFKLQILLPFPVQEIGNISQIFCIFHEVFRLTLFLEESKGGYESYHKSAEFDEAKNWLDEHTFFSAKDVELAIDGIHEGKYTKVVLEWGTQALDFFPGVQNDLMVIWCTNNTGKGNTRFLAKEGTVTQVKFWLVNYLKFGVFEEMSGWADITDQIEKANRKGKKKHG